MIAGGGNIGTRLARSLESYYQVKLVERDPDQATRISEELHKTVVLQGDCADKELMLEENIDRLGQRAGELGILGVPVFVFHEGGDPAVRRAFEEIARLSGGAYCPFDTGSARQLRELLRAVAVYAAGGRKALLEFGDRNDSSQVRQLTSQLRGKR